MTKGPNELRWGLFNRACLARADLGNRYLQRLQVALLGVAEQGGNAMIVPHAAHVGVFPQWEDLSNDGHPAQRAVNELHDICIAHFLKMEKRERDIS